MPRPSRRAATNTADAWLRLPQNVQTGFLRLVQDNEDKVRNFLTTESREDTPPVKLCELCAGMMRQQKLSAAGFLTRFFDKDSLAIHAALVGKSPKGGVPTLAERVAGAWARGPVFDEVAADQVKRAGVPSKSSKAKKKRRTESASPAVAAGAFDALGIVPTLAVPLRAVPTARCTKCEEGFIPGDNHHGACFGHHGPAPMYEAECQLVDTVKGHADDALGTIWKLGCCGKIFPSPSPNAADVSAVWCGDLAGQAGIGGEGCLKGLCRAAIETGVGRGPHLLPSTYLDEATWGTWEEQRIYYESLPGKQPASPVKLLGLRTRHAVEDTGWTVERAWVIILKMEAAAAAELSRTFDVSAYADEFSDDLVGLW
eukprot:m.61052 g.61052  ORF g.61052 m.61052 type:complete len:371 (-) comp17517_c0_seq1:122-1234(-)